MEIQLLEWPNDQDWMEVKRRALITIGKSMLNPPDIYWKVKMLNARHSPIRYLRFSFLLKDIPYWVSVHLCRHVHAQPYVRSQRNDRQEEYDRNSAPQNSPVSMIWDINAEELMIISNKRLCSNSSPETRGVVEKMGILVMEKCPEFKGMLVPACIYQGGVCHEIKPCEKMEAMKKDHQRIGQQVEVL